MTFDIVLVLYNSAQWLPLCLNALLRTTYNHKKLNLIIVDNASPQSPAQTLQQLQPQMQAFGSVQSIRLAKNLGFGGGCNAGAAKGSAKHIFFLNVDTEVSPTVFSALQAAIGQAGSSVAAFECRQLPFETGHHIDPVTLQTTWASAAALVVRRDAFQAVGGFDQKLFMYCEDVDLSWNLRAHGYTLQYVPAAAVTHYTYADSPAQKDALPAQAAPNRAEYVFGLYGNLMLRYKYGTLADIWGGWRVYLGALRRPLHFENVRRMLAKQFAKHLVALWGFLGWRLAHPKQYKAQVAQFAGGFSPERGGFRQLPLLAHPLVSVVVRSCNRPAVLRRTLQCLQHQTYQNFEVVVVEDGPPKSEALVHQQLAGIPHQYHAMGERMGRGKAGNQGLALAKGEYCNFLDDDDYFYPDHIEMLLAALQHNPTADFATAGAMALHTTVASTDPYQFTIQQYERIVPTRLDEFLLCQTCRLPIQAVLFKKSLFLQQGGLHEGIHGNEDWFMWLKYFAYGRRISQTGVDIPRATSLFLVPADGRAAQERIQAYRQYEAQMLDDPAVVFSVTPRQMRRYYNDFMGDILHLHTIGALEKYLDDWQARPKV